MRWIFVVCMLLTAAANVLSRPHQKRDLTYIKNLIASKLFGTDTIVIQQPEIPKNETYQIYKIKGHDNILLKVIRKKEAEKEEQPEEHKDDIYQGPVIVNPDIAIIGRYLGTSTEAETLLAIENAKNLLKTGVLIGKRDNLIKEVVVPMTPKFPYNYYVAQEHGKLQNILTEERDPFYVHTPGNDQAEQIQVVNRNQFPVLPEYPPIVLASGIKYEPLQTKHPYEQKGASGDMPFESYNNQDLIVPRTSKVPSLPQFIKLSLADVDSTGSNPYLIRPQNLAKTNKSTNEVPKDYIFVPPENVDIPPPNMIPKTSQIQEKNNGTKGSSEIDFNNARDDKLNLENEDAETLQGDENSLNNHPIVVLDDKVSNQKQVESANRVQPGKSNLVTFTGGPIF